jgi:hypothetical protein
VLFILIGAIIMWRIRVTSVSGRKPALVAFAALVLVSGVLCFLLDEHWFRMSYMTKVPLYALLGIAVCFALTFSCIDVVNWTIG